MTNVLLANPPFTALCNRLAKATPNNGIKDFEIMFLNFSAKEHQLYATENT